MSKGLKIAVAIGGGLFITGAAAWVLFADHRPTLDSEKGQAMLSAQMTTIFQDNDWMWYIINKMRIEGYNHFDPEEIKKAVARDAAWHLIEKTQQLKWL